MDETATEAAVEASGVVQTFGRVRALDGLDLGVRRGEILGLVVPNGAGKTTFIRLIAGLLRPTTGEITVLGGKPGARGIVERTGYMTQSPALYEDLTVRENLVFFGRLYGLTRARANASAEALEDLMGLGAKRTALVRELSGGQRQRTNLACAMVHGPELLLLDEPTVGVDPVLRRSLWDHFSGLNARGTTILLPTHVMDEAEHCSRVAMIASGRTIAAGSSEELRERAGAATLEDAYLAFSSKEASA